MMGFGAEPMSDALEGKDIVTYLELILVTIWRLKIRAGKCISESKVHRARSGNKSYIVVGSSSEGLTGEESGHVQVSRYLICRQWRKGERLYSRQTEWEIIRLRANH